jgi:hypothetical protein
MIFLFVTRKGNPSQQRFIAKEGSSWGESLHAIGAAQEPPINGHNDLKIEFPSEEEFFSNQHAASVSLL